MVYVRIRVIPVCPKLVKGFVSIYVTETVAFWSVERGSMFLVCLKALRVCILFL